MREINVFQDEVVDLRDAAQVMVNISQSISQSTSEIRERTFQLRRMLVDAVEADEKHNLLSDRTLLVDMYNMMDRAYAALDGLYNMIHRVVD